jgi:carbamate kinase
MPQYRMWTSPDGDPPPLEHHPSVRILLKSGESDAELVAAMVVAGRHQVVLAHSGDVDHPLELALRNALPGEEVVTVPVRVVVNADDPTRPQALLGLRSARALIAADATVICALGALPPVVVGKTGEMRAVEATVDEELALALLARRLDASRLVSSGELSEELGYARPA